jgi:hypothetical protein
LGLPGSGFLGAPELSYCWGGLVDCCAAAMPPLISSAAATMAYRFMMISDFPRSVCVFYDNA